MAVRTPGSPDQQHNKAISKQCYHPLVLGVARKAPRMSEILALATANIVSPIILSFVLGLAAALARSDLTFPEAAAKALSIYLLFAIGFKGGVSVAGHGVDGKLARMFDESSGESFTYEKDVTPFVKELASQSFSAETASADSK